MAYCQELSSIPPSIGGLASLRTLSDVIVDEAGKSGFELSALGRLKSVKGEMEIRHLERVREVKDAQEANLREKSDLDRLTLTWKEDDNNDQQLQVQILESLRPSSKLKYLSMFSYQGAVFPQWMMKDITSFPYIRSLILHSCKNCPQLPALWRLPSLKRLELRNLESLRWLIEGERDSDGQLMCVGFPSLEKLILRDLRDFEGVLMHSTNDMNMNNHNFNFFPCLSRLTIRGCSKSSFSNLGPLPSLRYLKIDAVAALPMFNNHNSNVQIFKSLEKLSIKGTGQSSLESLRDRMFQELSSLRVLTIDHFRNLKSLRECLRNLSSLEELKIQYCFQLVDISNVIYLLPSLRSLSIIETAVATLDCSIAGLAGLPQEIPHRLPFLRYLELRFCPNLEALPDWLSDAMYLETIEIKSCSKLESIPNSVQGLTNLKSLIIRGCRKFSRRCRKETGEDWNNIKHIPHIEIEGVDMHALN